MNAEREISSVNTAADTVLHPSLLSYPLCWLFCWCVIPVIYMFFSWLSSSLTLSSDRLTMRKGLIARSVVDIPYSGIQNIRIEQSVLGRILGYGTLMAASSGTGGYEIVFERLGCPFEFMEEIKRRQEAASIK